MVSLQRLDSRFRPAVLGTQPFMFFQFISFEDETDIFETVFFPRVYKKYALRLLHHAPYILRGKVDTEFGVISLNVLDIERMRCESIMSRI